MKSFKALPATILFLIGAISASAASADVIEFDDIAGIKTAVPGTYQGFQWENMSVVNGHSFNPKLGLGPGFSNAVVSADKVAFTTSATNQGAFFSDTAFTFNSLYVTEATADGTTTFFGYVGNVLTYQMDVASTISAPTLATFNWTGVNRISFTNASASNVSVFDNITVNAAILANVPEPGSTTMLLTGLGLMGFIARRRKSV